jgi:FrmR/RcnR family transcriptional regulator, repressor of rcnA expression
LENGMSHTTREKMKLLNRVRRIRGQMEAVERSLEDEKGCAEGLQLIAGGRGAINGLMAEVVEDHILLHVADHALAQNERNEGAAELIDVVRAYLK